MYVSESGLVCPVGFDAESSCAALRAGISAFEEQPYWDSTAMPVLGAAVAGVGTQFGARILELLCLALNDCLSRVSPESLENVPLLVGLAEPGRPGGSAELAETIIPDVEEVLGVRFHPGYSRAIPKGHSSGFECLAIARSIIQAGEAPGCLVCGVDSLLNASTLHWLDRHWRLKREDNLDGLIPGEAAAVVFVEGRAPADRRTGTRIVGLGFGREPVSIMTDEPLLGLGLAEAGREALAEAGWGFHQLDFRISDANGESYGFREQALVEARLARVVRSEAQPHWHMADSIGDTGAAAGIVQLVAAAAAWGGAYAPGERAACFSSAVPGDRAVALLQRVGD